MQYSERMACSQYCSTNTAMYEPLRIRILPSAVVVLPLLGRQGSFLVAAPDQAASSPPSPASWSPSV